NVISLPLFCCVPRVLCFTPTTKHTQTIHGRETDK
ncbi:hypothetical protein D039_0224B, partial [Vibrio parahaemolyticus EKP-028]